MSKTKVVYKDVAPGADRNAQVAASGYSADSVLTRLPFGVDPEAVATLERNNWRLNGMFQLRASQPVALWSSAQSGSDGRFAAPPTITCSFSNQYSSTGITVVFDRAAGGYCSEINVKWYQGGTLKADVDFHPDSTSYYCEQTVTSYDKIVITLNRTAIPNRYAKVEHILFGVFRQFGMTDLRSASVVNEMDGIAESLPVSTFRWQLDSRENVDFLFQLKQPMEIYNDANLLGVYYIDSHNRKTDSIYDVECYDAIGVLGESAFPGGVYSGKSAKALLAEIVGEDFSIEYAADVADTNLTGIIEDGGTKRDAIQQVLFAWGVCMSTDGADVLKVFNLDTSMSEIGKNRTYPGTSIKTASIVTEVRVIAHTYTQSTNGNVEVGGVKYDDTKATYSVTNPDVTANDKQNVKEFRSATLVSPSNAQAVAQRIYNWYQRRSTVSAKIVWGGESLGDFVSFPNSWDGLSAGNITKMEIKLSNTVVAKCEAVG